MPTATIAEPQQTHEIKITRTFDAPRELVWQAWTNHDMLKQWMGPRGFKTTELDMPLTPGERWRRTMVGNRPGSDTPVILKQHGTVREVRPPELLVYTFAWDDPASVGLTNMDIEENTVTVHLEERGNKTAMTFTQGPFLSAAACDGHTGGWNSVFDKFAEFLLAKQPNRIADPNDVPTELHLKRTFSAPLQLVFDAWAKPEILAQWWGPTGFTNTVEKWETHSGGEIYVIMHAPDGVDHRMGGRFFEFYPPYRFHFTSGALDQNGDYIFENWNSVFFEEVEGGTQITLDVHVRKTTDGAERYIKSMSAGWNLSLDKLSNLLRRQ